jgi:hypothetical protein
LSGPTAWPASITTGSTISSRGISTGRT